MSPSSATLKCVPTLSPGGKHGNADAALDYLYAAINNWPKVFPGIPGGLVMAMIWDPQAGSTEEALNLAYQRFQFVKIEWSSRGDWIVQVGDRDLLRIEMPAGTTSIASNALEMLTQLWGVLLDSRAAFISWVFLQDRYDRQSKLPRRGLDLGEFNLMTEEELAAEGVAEAERQAQLEALTDYLLELT